MTSIVFPPGKFFCYLRHPKTASQSMTDWVIDFAKQNNRPYLTSEPYEQKIKLESDCIISHHMYAVDLKKTIPQWWEMMEKIVTVRNPWNLLASKFFYSRKTKEFSSGYSLSTSKTFKDFCYRYRDLNGTLNIGTNYYKIDGKIIADHIIPIENLQQYLNDIFRGYVVPKVQHTNIGPVTQDKYKNLYTDDIHDMIKEYFWYEIKEFNYSF